jgi:hypothetical protein
MRVQDASVREFDQLVLAAAAHAGDASADHGASLRRRDAPTQGWMMDLQRSDAPTDHQWPKRDDGSLDFR